MIVRYDFLETVDPGEIRAFFKVIAPNLHFLGGQMVLGKQALLGSVGSIGAVWKTAADFVKPIQRLLGYRLVAANIGDLLIF